MRLGRLQAREFAKTYNLSDDSLAVRYAALEGESRCVRQRFYKENDMYKTGTMRRLGQAVDDLTKVSVESIILRHLVTNNILD